jgi:hypothetical protein
MQVFQPEGENQVTIKGQRRSKRLLLDVPLVIRGEAEDKSAFQEETFTVIVSAHGALVVLGTKVPLGQKVLLTNPKKRRECEGTVIFLGPPYAGLATVGIEFTHPAPEFWAVDSPPPDWGLTRSSSRRPPPL